MNTPLKIYVDRLHSGQEEEILEEVNSSILDIQEPHLKFAPKIKIDGKAYLVDDHLILQLNIHTEIVVPCSICNNEIKKPLTIKQFTHTAPLSTIPSHVHDYTSEVREAILLNTPDFIECNDGKCPEREVLKKFIKTAKNAQDSVQYPFSELDK